MAEVRVGGECRGFIEVRLPHGHPHGFGELVISGFEILADFAICDARQASRAKTAVREERCEFEERESVRGERIERIAQKLVCPSAEIAEMPAVLQYFSEFHNPDEVRRFLLQRI